METTARWRPVTAAVSVRTGALVTNGAANAVTFAIVGVINLVIVSLLIRTFGLDGYGLFVIARLLLPTGLLALFDFGLPEATTRYVAYHGTDLARQRIVVTASLAATFAIALVVALGLYLARDLLVQSIQVGSAANAVSLDRMVLLLVMSMVPLFIGVIIESILKGMERFVAIRAVELVAAILFLLGVLWAIAHRAAIDDVVLTLIATLVLRYVLLTITLLYLRGAMLVPLTRDEDEGLRGPFFRHGLAVMWGKILSLININFASVVLSLTTSVALVGIFDAIMRLPRFVKAIMGQVNSVLIPFTAKLYSQDDGERIARLLEKGTALQMYLFAPALLAAAWYAPEIMAYWLGDVLAAYANWLALMFGWGILIIFIGVGSAMAVAKVEALHQLNRASLFQLVANVAIALGLMAWYPIEAFLLATFVSTLLIVPYIALVLRREFGFRYARLFVPLLVVLACAVPSAAISALMPTAPNLGLFLLQGVLWVGLAWVLLFTLGLDRSDRQVITGAVMTAFTGTNHER